MDVKGIQKVVETWQSEYEKLGDIEGITTFKFLKTRAQ